MEKILETKIVKGSIGGIELQFIDLRTSGTPAFVFKEMNKDDYGINQISINENDTIIDIGANIGMFSIYVKKKFNCKVISFEPVLENFNNFKKNILLNGLSVTDFELHNTAITSTDGDRIKIGTSIKNTGSASIFHKNPVNFEYCVTETLNKYITSDCKYLKIDCEGGEYEIIPSILNLINTFKYIGIEYHKYNTSQNPDELNTLINKHFNGKIFSTYTTK